jgi:hypothetical protein
VSPLLTPNVHSPSQGYGGQVREGSSPFGKSVPVRAESSRRDRSPLWSSRRTGAAYQAVFDVPADSEFHSVEVSHRGDITVSQDDLVERGAHSTLDSRVE